MYPVGLVLSYSFTGRESLMSSTDEVSRIVKKCASHDIPQRYQTALDSSRSRAPRSYSSGRAGLIVEGRSTEWLGVEADPALGEFADVCDCSVTRDATGESEFSALLVMLPGRDRLTRPVSESSIELGRSLTVRPTPIFRHQADIRSISIRLA